MNKYETTVIYRLTLIASQDDIEVMLVTHSLIAYLTDVTLVSDDTYDEQSVTKILTPYRFNLIFSKKVVLKQFFEYHDFGSTNFRLAWDPKC